MFSNIEKGGVLLSLLMLAYALFCVIAEYYTDGLFGNDKHSLLSVIIAIILPILLFLFPPGEVVGVKYWRLLAIALFFHMFKLDSILLSYFFLIVAVILDIVVFCGFYILVKKKQGLRRNVWFNSDRE
ncbi:MAG: hypothetical protein AB2795_19525 [Candidatus Thiodiazotropha endolucinida]